MFNNIYLLFAAALTAIAALLHIACIIFGGSWYRFFGAGESMAKAAEKGRLYPAAITFGIAAALALCSAYALSGSGLMFTGLPLLKPVLALIAVVFLLRGSVGMLLIRSERYGNSAAFWFWSSSVCLAIGIAYYLGLMMG